MRTLKTLAILISAAVVSAVAAEPKVVGGPLVVNVTG